ncbi:MAG TPA: glycosyltransferase family 2 protein [Rhodothermales bacterium]|nr:glycosyltransferase family 2 protein [Rhodothermales bacterium]
MKIEGITPLVLTYNEAINIGRVLDQLTWATEVLVIDSLSNDATKAIATQYPNVRFLERPFDTHAAQWQYGHDQVQSEWVLSLDADYILRKKAPDELRRLPEDSVVNGYEASFTYCIYETELSASLYPPRVVLYRKSAARYIQDGHTQRLIVEGEVGTLKTTILHDDRKRMDHWLASQQKYARLEAQKLASMTWKDMSIAQKIRWLRIPAILVMPLYCLFGKGLIFQGAAGWFYTWQRTCFEVMLCLYLMERDFTSHSN